MGGEAVGMAAHLDAFLGRLEAGMGVSASFRGAAREAQTTAAHEWLLSGPAETGKTWAWCWRLDTLARETPKAHGAIVRRVRADMVGSVLRTWERVAGIRGAPEPYGGQDPRWYDYPNGTRIEVAGLDRDSKTLSAEFDWIAVNQAEELTDENWSLLASRVTGRGAVTRTPMVFGDCNPGPASHWILSRKPLRLLESYHRDNPTLFAADGTPTAQWTERTLPTLEALVGVRRDRLLLGKWVSAEGTVYDFRRGVHLVPRFEIPRDWRRVRAIDFGYTNPFVCQWWAIDGDGRMFLYRELYRTRRIVEDHARQIVSLSAGEQIEATVSDHDAEDRATLHARGVETIPASKAVGTGIQAVQRRLREAGDKRPRLFVLEGSLVERDEELSAAHKPCSTAEEFEVYAWQKGRDGGVSKEEPAKVFDHGMDAMRYGVAYVDGLLEAGTEDAFGTLQVYATARRGAY